MNRMVYHIIEQEIRERDTWFYARDVATQLSKRLPTVSQPDVATVAEDLVAMGFLRHLTPTERTGHQGIGNYKAYVRRSTVEITSRGLK